PIDPEDVIDALARAAEPGLVATTGPRYFGFVTGGALPATVAAEWLTAVWDQPATLYVMSPAASVVEEVAGSWLLDLLGLPATARAGCDPTRSSERSRRGARSRRPRARRSCARRRAT